MDEDPFPGWGLRPVELADRATLNSCFALLAEPLSDYTFSQLFTWRNSLRIFWKRIRGHLCVFANGTGDLTLLMPPIGDTGGDAALAEAFEIMDAYNAGRGVLERGRVEYVSDELLKRFSPAGLSTQPMGADYLYDAARMIDLSGGDLASKRQAKNRFMRNHEFRVEPYHPSKHRAGCLALLEQWKVHQDAQHLDESNASAIKRSKESIATALCLDTAGELGLKGMVVFAQEVPGGSAFRVQGSEGDSAVRIQISVEKASTSFLNPEPRTLNPGIRGFTFGEYLGSNQSSITIEKTDLSAKGLAQFIFSEFCRLHWADRPLVNVGDDWGLETLAWTKQSYRPVKLLRKHLLRKVPAVVSGPTTFPAEVPAAPLVSEIPAALVPAATIIRRACKADLPDAARMEQSSFTAFAISRRQLQYHQQRASSIFLVAEQAGRLVGDGIALVRTHKTGLSGRIYSLVVREDSRGQRLGAKLLEALISQLESRGVKRIYLEVQESNTPALRLYERCGFARIGILPGYYGAGQDGVHMMCRVPAIQTAGTAAAPLMV